jgi:hypothetical protein
MKHLTQKYEKVWEKSPFLERLQFLMYKFNLTQEVAEPIAKLDYKKVNQQLNKI